MNSLPFAGYSCNSEEDIREFLRGSNATYIQTTEAEVERITTRALESKIDYSNIFE